MKKNFFFLIAVMFLCSFASVSNADEIEIHGFASSGYLKSKYNNYLGKSKVGLFEFNEFGLNINKNVTDNIRIGMQLYSFDMGNFGNNNIKLDWAFLDYQWKESLGIKVGKFKTPLGLYNELQDYDMLWVPVLLPQSVYTKYLRETMISTQGASLYGNIPISFLGHLRYDIYTGAQEVDPDGGMLKYVNTTDVTFGEAVFEDYIGGRLKWYTPLRGLVLVGSAVNFEMYFTGTAALPPPAPSGTTIDAIMDFTDFSWIIGSLEYTYKDFIFSAEYSRMDMDITVATPEGVFLKDMSRVRDGYYAQMAYSVNTWLETGTYYSVMYQDKDDKKGTNYPAGSEHYAWQKDLAFTLRFNITDFWNVKFEQHFMNGVFLAEPDNPPTASDAAINGTPPGCPEKIWTMFAIKTTFSF